MMNKLYLIILSVVFVAGCQTTSSVRQQTINKEEAEEALTAVAEAVSGKELSDEDVRQLEKQIMTDKEAQSAVKVITESVSGQAPQVKYCPITGKRYAAQMEICPEHHVELKVVSP